MFMVSFTVQKLVSLITSRLFIFLIKNSYLFMAVLALCCCEAFSLVVMSRGFSLVALCGFLISVAPLEQSTGFRLCGLSS